MIILRKERERGVCRRTGEKYAWPCRVGLKTSKSKDFREGGAARREGRGGALERGAGGGGAFMGGTFGGGDGG